MLLCVTAVVSLAIIFDPHISPPRISPTTDKPIKKALQTQISPGLIGRETRHLKNSQLRNQQLIIREGDVSRLNEGSFKPFNIVHFQSKTNEIPVHVNIRNAL